MLQLWGGGRERVKGAAARVARPSLAAPPGVG
jgi:hypothetical protein